MYTLERDAFTGGECYRNLATGEVLSQKSVLLGNERWDQEDMLLWTVDEVRHGHTPCVICFALCPKTSSRMYVLSLKLELSPDQSLFRMNDSRPILRDTYELL